jgi:hypothetical protein
MPGLAWSTVLLFVLPHIAGMKGMCHYTQQLVEMGSGKLFAQTGLELQSSLSPPPEQLGLQAWVIAPGSQKVS